eukprot:Sspe_Gene.52376::Locus_29034_Transcript_1_1_Confidence_1.000_Length_3228::g.52376::m.52376/K01872/AARS, alaS; alanyl-tRNA synthetase
MCVILDRTNFYYESGGQIWDTGVISGKGWKVRVNKVLKMGGYICHIGCVEEGEVKVGDDADLAVDYERRMNVGSNHTATHQLNHSLREVLQFGKNMAHARVDQKGSSVEEDFLRFDFSWVEKLSTDPGSDVEMVEKTLNEAIKEARPVYAAEVPQKLALSINGVRSLEGETYPDPVRVVCIGKPIEELLKDVDNEEWKKYSVEFCGGTHLETLADIQLAVIASEEALTTGVRRMIVLTREKAREALRNMDAFEEEHRALWAEECDPADYDEKIKALNVLNKRIGDTVLPLVRKTTLRNTIKEQVEALHEKKKFYINEAKVESMKKGEEAAKDGKNVIVAAFNDYKDSRDALTEFTVGAQKANKDACVLVSGVNPKKNTGMVLAVLPPEKAKTCSAVDWVKEAVGGKGGGKKERAMTGYDASQEKQVLERASAWAEKNLM